MEGFKEGSEMIRFQFYNTIATEVVPIGTDGK